MRVSFFGGGSDFPEFYTKHGGAVIGGAIDKYVYLTVSRFPSQLFDYNIRLSYRKVECVNHIDAVEHAPFREILREMAVTRDVELHVASDLPSFSGLGSSSAFSVGLIKALSRFTDREMTANEIAEGAIKIEREILAETVGCQDQTFAAHGGFNVITFSHNGERTVEPIAMSSQRLEELHASILVMYTGISRRAMDVEKSKFSNFDSVRDEVLRLRQMVDKAHNILTGAGNLEEFGGHLHESWKIKRSLSKAVTNDIIDKAYDKAIAAGALGGKLLGAGGGGCLLFFVPPERRAIVKAALDNMPEISIKFGAPGTQIIFEN